LLGPGHPRLGTPRETPRNFPVTGDHAPCLGGDDKNKKYTPLGYPNLQDAGIAKIASGISAPTSVKKSQSFSVSFRLSETDG
jgi:hypothetical protein